MSNCCLCTAPPTSSPTGKCCFASWDLAGDYGTTSEDVHFYCQDQLTKNECEVKPLGTWFQGQDCAQNSVGRINQSVPGCEPNQGVPSFDICEGCQNCEECQYAVTCFIKGSKVLMGDGSYKEIQDVSIGDTVKSLNGDNNVLGFESTILGSRKLVSLNGSKAFFSYDHPIYTENGLKSVNSEVASALYPHLDIVGDLEVGDTIVTPNGPKSVESIELVEDDPLTKLYELSLDGNNIYYVEDIAVHNCTLEKCCDTETGDCDISKWYPKSDSNACTDQNTDSNPNRYKLVPHCAFCTTTTEAPTPEPPENPMGACCQVKAEEVICISTTQTECTDLQGESDILTTCWHEGECGETISYNIGEAPEGHICTECRNCTWRVEFQTYNVQDSLYIHCDHTQEVKLGETGMLSTNPECEDGKYPCRDNNGNEWTVGRQIQGGGYPWKLVAGFYGTAETPNFTPDVSYESFHPDKGFSTESPFFYTGPCCEPRICVDTNAGTRWEFKVYDGDNNIIEHERGGYSASSQCFSALGSPSCGGDCKWEFVEEPCGPTTIQNTEGIDVDVTEGCPGEFCPNDERGPGELTDAEATEWEAKGVAPSRSVPCSQIHGDLDCDGSCTYKYNIYGCMTTEGGTGYGDGWKLDLEASTQGKNKCLGTPRWELKNNCTTGTNCGCEDVAAPGISDKCLGKFWIQLGHKIPGELGTDTQGYGTYLDSDLISRVITPQNSDITDNNQAGYSVSLNEGEKGNVDNPLYVAIGAPGNRDAVGQVRVYKYGESWTQVGEDIVPILGPVTNTFQASRFGESVSISDDGKTVAVGGPSHDYYDDDISNADGFVSVHEYVDSEGTGEWEWIQKGQVIVSEFAHDQSNFFGRTVSLSANGDRVVVSNTAGSFDNEKNYEENIVQIFDYENNSWKFIGSIDGACASLRPDGKMLAVQATVNDESVVQVWKIKVQAGDDTLEKVGSDITYDGTHDEFKSFGSDLSLIGTEENGGVVAVGIPMDNLGALVDESNPTDEENSRLRAGRVQVFSKAGNGDWAQIGQNIDAESYQPLGDAQSIPIRFQYFGYSVSITKISDVITLAVGMSWAGQGRDPGVVRVFEFEGSNWVQDGPDIVANYNSLTDGLPMEQGFGSSVSINSNKYVAVGIPKDRIETATPTNTHYIGSTIVYEYSPTRDCSAEKAKSQGTQVGNQVVYDAGVKLGCVGGPIGSAGACCYSDPLTGDSKCKDTDRGGVMLELECDRLGGTFYAGETCYNLKKPGGDCEPRGACCGSFNFLVNGVTPTFAIPAITSVGPAINACLSDVRQSECLKFHGLFHPSRNCDFVYGGGPDAGKRLDETGACSPIVYCCHGSSPMGATVEVKECLLTHRDWCNADASNRTSGVEGCDDCETAPTWDCKLSDTKECIERSDGMGKYTDIGSCEDDCIIKGCCCWCLNPGGVQASITSKDDCTGEWHTGITDLQECNNKCVSTNCDDEVDPVPTPPTDTWICVDNKCVDSKESGKMEKEACEGICVVGTCCVYSTEYADGGIPYYRTIFSLTQEDCNSSIVQPEGGCVIWSPDTDFECPPQDPGPC